MQGVVVLPAKGGSSTVGDVQAFQGLTRLWQAIRAGTSERSSAKRVNEPFRRRPPRGEQRINSCRPVRLPGMCNSLVASHPGPPDAGRSRSHAVVDFIKLSNPRRCRAGSRALRGLGGQRGV